MLSCERCQSYMVEGQVACAICGFDPTAVPDPEPEPATAEREPARSAPRVSSGAIRESSGRATPFLALGVIVIAVVGFLVISGSGVFVSDEDAMPAGASITSTTATEFGSWNNDEGGDVGSGDDVLREDIRRACARGGSVEGVPAYTRARGTHPTLLVDLRFGRTYPPEEVGPRPDLLPRQAEPSVLRTTELLLCVTDRTPRGVTAVNCPAPANETNDEAAPAGKVPVELPGNDTDYRLVVAATGEVLWRWSDVFPAERVESCDDPQSAVDWARERLALKSDLAWVAIADWVLSDGNPLEADLGEDEAEAAAS